LISSCANSTWSAASECRANTHNQGQTRTHIHTGTGMRTRAQACQCTRVPLGVRAYATRSRTPARNAHASARALHLPPADGNMERRIASNVGNVHYFQFLLVLVQSKRFGCTQHWPSAPARKARTGRRAAEDRHGIAGGRQQHAGTIGRTNKEPRNVHVGRSLPLFVVCLRLPKRAPVQCCRNTDGVDQPQWHLHTRARHPPPPRAASQQGPRARLPS